MSKETLKSSQYCEGFFRDPSPENFARIIESGKDTESLHMFRIAARSKWDSLEMLNNSEQLFLDLKKNLLLNSGSKITMEELDSIWCMYWATGDPQYPEYVKSIFQGREENGPVMKAAYESYKSYLEKGYKYDLDE